MRPDTWHRTSHCATLWTRCGHFADTLHVSPSGSLEEFVKDELVLPGGHLFKQPMLKVAHLPHVDHDLHRQTHQVHVPAPIGATGRNWSLSAGEILNGSSYSV